MTQSFISSTTLQPSRWGEVYGDRDLKAFGDARWVTGTDMVQTKGVAILVASKDGGSISSNTIPDGTYPLAADGSALWARINRLGGAHTLINGVDLVVFAAGSQPTPTQDWCQLFTRYNSQVVALGGYAISSSTQYTKIGFARSSDYDAIVGSVSNPAATHTDLQAAINDSVDGDRILVLQGIYTVGTAQNIGIDASAAYAWTGKTITIEGEGYGTIIQNTGAMTRAFGIQSGSATSNGSGGNGSRILGIHLKGFVQTLRLDGGAALGLREVQTNVWVTGVAALTNVTTTGTGTFDENVIEESVITTVPVFFRQETRVTPIGITTLKTSGQTFTYTGTNASVGLLTNTYGLEILSTSVISAAARFSSATTNGILVESASAVPLLAKSSTVTLAAIQVRNLVSGGVVLGLVDFGGSGELKISLPAVITSYSIKVPAAQGAANTGLVNDGGGNLSWSLPYRVSSLVSVTSTTTITVNSVNSPNLYIGNSASAFTINLSTAVGMDGISFRLKNIGLGIITLDANGAETIDSLLTKTVNQFSAVELVASGGNWVIV